MPNVKSALKRVKVSQVKRARNFGTKSAIKTYTRKYESAIADGDIDTAKGLYTKVTSLLDKAANKGVIHKNNAARRKSRLAAKM
jgi:small subunit ribosomal protein S20